MSPSHSPRQGVEPVERGVPLSLREASSTMLLTHRPRGEVLGEAGRVRRTRRGREARVVDGAVEQHGQGAPEPREGLTSRCSSLATAVMTWSSPSTISSPRSSVRPRSASSSSSEYHQPLSRIQRSSAAAASGSSSGSPKRARSLCDQNAKSQRASSASAGTGRRWNGPRLRATAASTPACELKPAVTVAGRRVSSSAKSM